jgi:hypothetical protein
MMNDEIPNDEKAEKFIPKESRMIPFLHPNTCSGICKKSRPLVAPTPRNSPFVIGHSSFLRQLRHWSFVILSLLGYFVIGHSSFLTAQLDDQIEAFRKAPEQKEADVIKILQSGIGEHRSAKAFASVQGWLNANPTESQELLYFAAQTAEYAGEWNVAVSFYRKFLKKKNLNAGAA